MSRLLCTLAMLAACTGATPETDDPVPGCPRVEQDVDQVSFELALFDVGPTRPIFLTNPCDVSLFFENPVIDGDGVFTASLSDIEIEPGGGALVEVVYEPPVGDYGPHAAALRMNHDGGELFVSIVGGVDPDQDGDGFEAVEVGGEDCDDFDASVGAPTEELDNGRDDDCDGLIDEDFVAAGDVLITELMLRPSVVRPEVGQWVELLNTSGRTVDLRHWVLRGTEGDLRVEDSVPVGPGELAVVALDTDAGSNGGIAADGGLAGEGAPMAIRDWSLDLFVGELQIAAIEEGDWPDPLGASIGLDPYTRVEAEARTPDVWCVSVSPIGEAGDLGTPGVDNDWCPQIDHDGDGASVLQGDCDDADPTRERRIFEQWDGKDNDCDDFADDLFADRAAFGLVVGTTRSGQFGGAREVQTHDWSGDGFDEILIAEGSLSYDLLILDGALVEGTSEDDVATLEIGRITSGRRNPFALRVPSDVDHDGDDDLVTLMDTQDGTHLLWAFEDAPVSGQSWGVDDAMLVVTDSRSTGALPKIHAVADQDLDGDGAVDVVYGEARDRDGLVVALSLADIEGVVGLDEVELSQWSGGEDTGLGVWTSAGDTDGDGYADIYVSESDPVSSAGSVSIWRIPGGKTLPASGDIAEAADLQIQGINRFGLDLTARTLIGDADDDGSLDLIVGDIGGNAVYVLEGIGSDSGVNGVTALADTTITSPIGEVGLGMDFVDYDGVGTPGLVLGASSFRVQGLLFGLSAATLSGGGSLDPSVADFTIRSTESNDRFGKLVVGANVNGDGDRNGLVAPASSLSTDSLFYNGGVFFFQRD